jgi:hypothetical protein
VVVIFGSRKEMNIFETSAAELAKLEERVKELSRRRADSSAAGAAWREAAQTFHASYNALAFPGGLAEEFELLRLGDLQAIELAVQYLEANPWYFRSGYHKVDMLKILSKHNLTDDPSARLRKVILDRVLGRPVREMRAYCRIAPQVSNRKFEAELIAITENSNRNAARHATWVLEYLRAGKKKSRPSLEK